MSKVAEGSVGFDNPDVQVAQTRDFSNSPAKVFRPKTGKTYRIKFTSKDVMLRRRHYNPLTKKYYRCLEYQGYCPVCIAASNKVNKIKGASDTFGANILVYEADDAGTIKQPLVADVHFWAFGSDKFTALRGIQNEWGDITGIDLTVTCTDEQFQKVTLSPGKKCFYTEDEAFRKVCDDKIQADSYPLDKFLCREVTMGELCEVFGLDQSYIPAHIQAQMTKGETGADRAVPPAPAAQQPAAQPQIPPAAAPPAQPQIPPAATEGEEEGDGAPKPETLTPGFKPPEVPKENFSDLEDISKLL
jgi:hypothetical protein